MFVLALAWVFRRFQEIRYAATMYWIASFSLWIVGAAFDLLTGLLNPGTPGGFKFHFIFYLAGQVFVAMGVFRTYLVPKHKLWEAGLLVLAVLPIVFGIFTDIGLVFPFIVLVVVDVIVVGAFGAFAVSGKNWRLGLVVAGTLGHLLLAFLHPWIELGALNLAWVVFDALIPAGILALRPTDVKVTKAKARR